MNGTEDGMSLARIGSGPFEVVEILDPEYRKVAGEILPDPTPVAGMDELEARSRCACCGASISWRVLVRDRMSDRHYMLGLTCAGRAQSGIDSRAIAAAKKRAMRVLYERRMHEPGFIEWLRTQPHSKGWAGKTRMDDVTYEARSSQRQTVLNAAWEDYKAGTDACGAERTALRTWLADNMALAERTRHPFIDKRGATLAAYIEWMLTNRTGAELTRALTVAKLTATGVALQKCRVCCQLTEDGSDAHAACVEAQLRAKYERDMANLRTARESLLATSAAASLIAKCDEMIKTLEQEEQARSARR